MKSFNETNGLPDKSIHALALDGQRLIFGGESFVGTLDLSTCAITQIVRAEDSGIIHAIQADTTAIWLAVDRKRFRVPRNTFGL